MKTVSIFEGKNKFSQIVADAANGEPQLITKNGKKTAVVISFEDYKRLNAKERPLSEFLLDNPARKYGMKLDVERDKAVTYREFDFEKE